MNFLAFGLAVVVSGPITSGEVVPQLAAKAPEPRIGQIFVIGNEITRDDVILRQLEVRPGQSFSYRDLHRSQMNLEQIGIFKPGSVKVTAEDDANNRQSDYKSIFVTVEETPTQGVRLMVGRNCLGEPVVSVVWEERNFDPFRWPVSRDDLIEGRAFRGAGQMLRLELLQIPLLSVQAPRLFQIGSFLAPVGVQTASILVPAQ
jgi:hypothetical protein